MGKACVPMGRSHLVPSTLEAVHGELNRVITQYSTVALSKAFVVVTKDGHRFRTLAA
ncbi:hypothetical protein [Leptolyngbya sp. KIOST-1]|uniref:hypothetical protein n=1 Tax=Leptolyngbya sp. KIOST-1 TaxID=1229172 RepID=UPI000A9BE1CC|nr:hypothetical protein [Leptolyngbya sp. KIOST-1]